MKERLKSYLEKNLPIDTEQLNAIMDRFTFKAIPKNTILLSAGDIARDVYFVCKGSIRTYYYSRNDMEKTRYVGFEESLVTSIPSFISQKPSIEYVDTLEDSEVCVISRSDFYQLVDEVPAWARFYVRLLEIAYQFQNDKIAALTTVSAKQRFDNLLKEHPHYYQRLSNRILASYLDIREETLSRLKSK
ncbi:cAMP-binding domain of CRP or a regulatory subunit of cAMP-dependent protein kinases [Mucilaginibacter gossypiicola]|uniref:cAMP-binding domain of CRP or a regulatory subunit of cAMP-dependent protein kinases n=1 Tax=Mucilaginibacter gossypiicola TaxID=551995 RepID=A0A1H8D0Q6_9SPHI|nr:Crp/Fnr family transcriptional regulator [Mucilaginibacter gossypiicola]SEN00795.1 cAMP-binding domain of CRP or a regulatory subunit of cAMP-dependent protein kinases [Mucilaginibacter gossypiicola]